MVNHRNSNITLEWVVHFLIWRTKAQQHPVDGSQLLRSSWKPRASLRPLCTTWTRTKQPKPARQSPETKKSPAQKGSASSGVLEQAFSTKRYTDPGAQFTQSKRTQNEVGLCMAQLWKWAAGTSQWLHGPKSLWWQPIYCLSVGEAVALSLWVFSFISFCCLWKCETVNNLVSIICNSEGGKIGT